MFKIIANRLKVLGLWLSGHHYDVKFSQIMKRTFCPPTSIESKKYYVVENVDENWNKLRLIKENTSIFWPASYSLVTFNEFICEVYEDYKLHTYEKYGNMIEADDIILDLGASEGFFSLYASKKCKKVYALEPDRNFVDAMEKSFLGIGDKIEIIHAGISDHVGYFYIENGIVHETEDCDKSDLMNLVSVDSLFYDKNSPITYIKADLEGFELKMLEGAKKTIKKYAPKISITSYHCADHAEKINEMIKEINPEYKIVFSGLSTWGTPSMIHAWVEK